MFKLMIGPFRHDLAFLEPAVEPRVSIYREAETALDDRIHRARDTLLSHQHGKGYWCYELEADCTIPAEYILMMHFMDEIDVQLEKRLAVYLRTKQAEHGGWSLYHGGEFDLSCSVKVYYALKLVGDEVGAPHMVRAREVILAHGGASRCNVFTRITLALFRQLPWRGVPFVPVEIMLLPRWFWFHLGKVSYWSRTVMVPLSILYSLRARAENPRGVDIRELFVTPPEQERNYFEVRSKLNHLLLVLERTARHFEALIPKRLRRLALQRAEQWFLARLNGTGGLGAIFPAMVNAHEALAWLGYPTEHPCRLATAKALRKLLVVHPDWAYCQPCLSPVWDTALACCVLEEFSDPSSLRASRDGLDWLQSQQVLDAPGDWRDSRPHLRGGGWPFQFSNGHYPDLDDTAAVGWAMLRSGEARYQDAVSRAAEWVAGMQSKNGGFAAFDVDNTHFYLNAIPFADHGALLDPPTADVTARCISLLALAGDKKYHEPIAAGLQFLRREQEQEGCWFGRWGTNYIYGTWAVLVALEVVGEDLGLAYVRRAVEWLKEVQRPDGGWGETNDSYADRKLMGQSTVSTPFQTAWALLGLMAAGEVHSLAVRRGIDYLQRLQCVDGLWRSAEFTAPGFPRVFYLTYHGYTKYFPLWALARYRKLLGR